MEGRKESREKRKKGKANKFLFSKTNQCIVTAFQRLLEQVWFHLSSQRPQSPRYTFFQASLLASLLHHGQLHSLAPLLCPYPSKEANSLFVVWILLWVGETAT